MSSSEEEFDEDMEFPFHGIQREKESLEHEKLKLWRLENRDDRLEHIRSIRSGEVEPTRIETYCQTFQDKIRYLERVVDTFQHRYDCIPKVCSMNGPQHIDVFVRIDQGDTGRFIKENARPYADRNFNLLCLYGRVLSDAEEVTGIAHAVLACVPKRCEVCGEMHVAFPNCGSDENVELERKSGLVLCIGITRN